VHQVVEEQRVQLGFQFLLSLRVLGVLPTLSVDPYRMQQVFSNVLENAILPAGGEVEVTVRAQGFGVLLTVSDNGIGLPPQAAESIFEPSDGRATRSSSDCPAWALGCTSRARLSSSMVGTSGQRVQARGLAR
jgi:signal transduction histidine kinase